MAQKNNIRSIRFCVWELPQKETELKEIQKQINQERQRLRELEKKRTDLQRIMSGLDRALNQCLYSTNETIQQLKQL